jgi:hypothetical protein
MPESFYLAPAAGEQAAALCDGAAEELTACAAQLDHDPCHDHPLRSLLHRLAETLSEFAVQFRAADAAYREADRGGADRFPRG